MTRSFDFDEQLRMSHGTSHNAKMADILMANIPGAVGVHKSHAANDRNGTD